MRGSLVVDDSGPLSCAWPYGWFWTLSPGRRIVWLAFCVACFQTTFQIPYLIITTRDSANVFSSLICGITLVLALIFLKGSAVRIRKLEILVSVALAGLAALSSLLGSTPFASSVRSFVVLTSALAGYWTARLLIDSESSRRVLQWLFLALLIPTIVLACAGVALTGKIHQFLDSHWHPVGARVILFSFAPLAMLGSQSKRVVIGGIASLCLSYGVLLLAGRYAGMESVVLIPVALCLLATCLSKKRSLRVAGLVFLIAALAAVLHIARQNAPHVAKEHQSVAYRAENVFFSWHIASKHPWLGIGPRAPRSPYLDDYQVRYPYVTKETFAQWTEELRTSENTPLTFMVDLGFPFLIVYGAAVLYLMWQLVRLSLGSHVRLFPHPLAVLVPVVGAILHFNVTEGLYQPHISWYFHILLGLVLGLTDQASAEKRG